MTTGETSLASERDSPTTRSDPDADSGRPAADAGRDFLERARRTVERERRRLADERDAFDRFHGRVREITTETGSAAATGTVAAVSAPTPTGLADVRDAYEETVMSVPHFEEDYGETYEESLRGEFGPELAAALTRQRAFDDLCKETLLEAAAEGASQRKWLLSALADEAEYLDEATGRVASIRADLSAVAFAERDPATGSFDALDGARDALVALDERCDALAADRQADLRRQERRLALPTDVPDLPRYVYRPLPVTYPVLSTVADLGRRIEARREAVERAIASSP
ncbi:MAG: hypothetical protein ABEJ40_09975 [Haloarculaceae archaeon]